MAEVNDTTTDLSALAVMPAPPARSPSPRAGRARMPPPVPRAAGPARAMLVEQGLTATEEHVGRLRSEGYDVKRISDPGSAVDLAQHWGPNIIFIADGRGAGGNSAFLSALKANDHTRHIPVALLSSYFNGRSERDGLTAFSRP
ncbi:MAG TPA: hypothetical protein VIO84_03960 [Candidatus Dormibacteraeota bacterium]